MGTRPGGCQDVGVLGSGSPAASTSAVHLSPASHPPAGPQPGRICFSKPREQWLTTPVSKQAKDGGRAAVNVKGLVQLGVSAPHTQSRHALLNSRISFVRQAPINCRDRHKSHHSRVKRYVTAAQMNYPVITAKNKLFWENLRQIKSI